MDTILIWLILCPLIGFLINGLLGSRLQGNTAGYIGTLAVFVPFLIAVTYLTTQDLTSPLIIKYFDWIKIADFHSQFSIQIDALSLQMTLIITGIGSLIHLYSIGYMHNDTGFARFFAYLNLFIFSMLLLVLGSNLLLLFFGWEGVGLCSYLLIGFWFKNIDYGYAARKAFIMNRIGDLGLILGIFTIWMHFGTIEFNEIKELAKGMTMGEPIIIVAAFLLFAGAIGKSAQIPLFTWLPDAMAGPTPVSALIHAATMVTAGIYLLVRTHYLFDLAPVVMNLVAWVGIATSLFAAVIGLRQNDIKKILAYSTVSQLGLMFVALGVGAYNSAMFHVTTHAFFKALLFLSAGSVIHALHGEQDIRKMGGLKHEIKTTYTVFLIGTLAICGIFPLSGMFSKDEVLNSLFEQNKILWLLAIVSSMLTAVYMFRMLFYTFFGVYRGSAESKSKIHESPKIMTIPLWALAILSILGGCLNLPHYFGHHISQKMAHYLDTTYIQSKIHESHISLPLEFGLIALVTAGVILIAFALYRALISKGQLPKEDHQLHGLELMIANKFKVDELYESTIIRPIQHLSVLWSTKVEPIFDWVFNIGPSAGFRVVGNTLRKVQNGNVEFYLLLMTISVLIIFSLKLIFKI